SYVFIESWSLGENLESAHVRLRGPWDVSGRRISHAEKRKLFQQSVLWSELSQHLPANLNRKIIQTVEKTLFSNA
ncbi:MAG: hypothetical protein ACRC2T_19755, partial [Thermoguttaceae bacterium]